MCGMRDASVAAIASPPPIVPTGPSPQVSDENTDAPRGHGPPPRDVALATTPQSEGGAGGASRAPVQAEIAVPCANPCRKVRFVPPWNGPRFSDPNIVAPRAHALPARWRACHHASKRGSCWESLKSAGPGRDRVANCPHLPERRGANRHPFGRPTSRSDRTESTVLPAAPWIQ